MKPYVAERFASAKSLETWVNARADEGYVVTAVVPKADDLVVVMHLPSVSAYFTTP